MHNLSFRRSLFLATLCGLLLGGCGGGSGGGPSAAGTPSLSAAMPLPEGHQVGVSHWPTGDTGSGGNGSAVGGLPCGVMDTTYHVHCHLSIFLDRTQLAIPAAVGITQPVITTNSTWPDGYVTSTNGGCYYNLHTHDTSGRLHIEAAAPTTFTLGQEFAIWGEPLSSTNVAGLTGKPIVIYINDGGNVTTYTGDPAAITLPSGRQVTIQVGSAISQIPNYSF